MNKLAIKSGQRHFSRREMEAGLEIYLIERILNGDYDNTCLLWSLIRSNGEQIRAWLNSMGDQKIKKEFRQLPQHVKLSIKEKCLYAI